MKTNKILIIAQAFYGNRTETSISPEDIDKFILGYSGDIKITEEIDRTVIKIPNTDNLVLIYNKYEEEKRLLEKDELFEKENYQLKPLAFITEDNIEIYSRCIVCRISENGAYESLQDEDYHKFMKYLAG
ncbi:MAG: hypothetical protein IKC46_06270 [Lachnospiraceae bacterium]|nr:hypothetical protein [Lachnospiraceae bacterium]